MRIDLRLTKKLISDVKLIQDIEMIRTRLGELEGKFGSKPVVVVTEKVARNILISVQFLIH